MNAFVKGREIEMEKVISFILKMFDYKGCCIYTLYNLLKYTDKAWCELKHVKRDAIRNRIGYSVFTVAQIFCGSLILCDTFFM